VDCGGGRFVPYLALNLEDVRGDYDLQDAIAALSRYESGYLVAVPTGGDQCLHD
jgi:hypothetical protein